MRCASIRVQLFLLLLLLVVVVWHPLEPEQSNGKFEFGALIETALTLAAHFVQHPNLNGNFIIEYPAAVGSHQPRRNAAQHTLWKSDAKVHVTAHFRSVGAATARRIMVDGLAIMWPARSKFVFVDSVSINNPFDIGNRTMDECERTETTIFRCYVYLCAFRANLELYGADGI